MSAIRLATRGSRLALAQCGLVERALLGGGSELGTERVIVKTVGDLRPDLSLAKVGTAGVGEGLFTRELENVLLEGRADVAVHSLKDLPTVLPAGLAMVATLLRAPVADVLVSRWPSGLAGLPGGARVGTSSVRRGRQLLCCRPDLLVTELRGNVPTRLGRVGGEGGLDAVILAEAGLRRLGYGWEGGRIEGVDGSPYAEVLSVEVMLPAAGQGAIGLEVREDDLELCELLGRVNHGATYLAVRAERELLRLLGGGCQMPVGVLGEVEGGQLRLRARVLGEGGESRAAEVEGDAGFPEDAARRAFEILGGEAGCWGG